MYTKEFIKENSKLVIILLLVIVALVGLTYAYLTLTLTGTKSNKIVAGTLSLVLNDTATSGITISNAVPMSDSEGLATTAYTFTLQNNGTITSAYTIYLDDVALGTGETRIADQYVKYSITKNSGTATTQLLTAIGSNPNRILDSGSIAASATNSYTLRVWVAYAADNTVMNQTFKGKLRIAASQ